MMITHKFHSFLHCLGDFELPLCSFALWGLKTFVIPSLGYIIRAISFVPANPLIRVSPDGPSAFSSLCLDELNHYKAGACRHCIHHLISILVCVQSDNYASLPALRQVFLEDEGSLVELVA
jgi:hypothetical protein